MNRTRDLLARGVKGGMRVAFLAKPSSDTIDTFFALWELGAIACPINPRLPLHVQKEFLQRLSPVFFLDGEVKASCEIVHEPGSLALLLFTSGSSGVPKIAALSLSNLLKNAAGVLHALPLSEEDIWQLALPLHHVGGIGILLRCLLAEASTSFSDGSILSLVPTQLYRHLRDATLGSTKAIIVGGAPLHPELLKEALKRDLPIYTTWGMTETASMVTLGKADETGHSGTLLPHRELKISPAGEILVRGETLFQGYLEDNSLRLPLTKDGWLATGDLGTLDKRGRLYCKGRKDRMFICLGENIQPEEIERELLTLPGVLQACVVSIPDPEAGDVPVAFIDGEIEETKWRSLLKERLASFKIPRRFFKLPLSVGLKPSLPQLAALAKSSIDAQE